MPQLSCVLGEPGGLGTGDLSGLEPMEERGQVTLGQTGIQEPKPGIRDLSVLTEPGRSKAPFAGEGRLEGVGRTCMTLGSKYLPGSVRFISLDGDLCTPHICKLGHVLLIRT